MALTDILKKIVESADTQAAGIMSAAESEAQGIRATFELEKQDKLAALEARQLEVLASLKTKAETMATRENKLKNLEMQQSVISKALTALYDHMVGASDDDYQKIIAKLASVIPAKSCILHAPKNRVEVTKKAVPSTVEIQASDAIKGGFILELGKAKIDNSFKNIVFSQFKEELTQIIAKEFKFVA